MYTDFYKVDEKPFQISSDPKYLWLGEKHKEALATLKYGVLDNKGFLLLTGDVGTGKTTLIHSLIQSLSDDIIFASVPDPALSKQDFFNFIALEFGMEESFQTKGNFLVRFRKFLLKAYDNNKKVLLIIDEAQLLTQDLLEEIRLLSNIEKQHTKLINIFFVGQNEFNESLKLSQNRAVRQRLTLNYNIDPLTPKETSEYVQYRLKVAGAKNKIFEDEALQQVFVYSAGFPRRINILCDHALLSGFVKETPTIDAETVKECAAELKLPEYTKAASVDKPRSAQAVSAPQAVTLPGQFASPGAIPPRQVVVQAAPYVPEKMDGTAKTLLLTVAGIIVLIGLVLWLMFPDTIAQLKKDILGPEKQLPQQTIEKPVNMPQAQPEAVHTIPPSTPPVEEPAPQVSLENNHSEGSTAGLEPGKTAPAEDLPKPPLPTEKLVIRFQHNTNNFSNKALEQLEAFAEVISHYPEVTIQITGHTDSEGYRQYNKKLSEFRANIVRSFLLGKGANLDQIKLSGKGSAEPVESNKTSWGRKMNRRVEIEVLAE